ncbi:MAG TPA: serine/threonine protein kinase [Oscillatoriaceae cyanobacterium M33_DOE_052]|uniref:Protein kinase n=1 Tax=Planktothricoides sp. SpSt-374 TaxID=2282167 RepID=A0A7C3VGI4_9CYAN|nr:serine/threonine protein kinase [Oscillatoriaceae cyanobacterium M33_DOE_052]
MSLCINSRCSKPQNADKSAFCAACGAELVVGGRYRVQRKLGTGGFGDTYEVLHGDSIRVLKVLRIEKIDSSCRVKVLSLFQQEARVLMQLDEPGIPKADGYFEFWPPNAEEPLHCLVMEKIEGVNLEEYHKQRRRPTDPELALEWLCQLVKILERVHARNIFHRDIKPANIMVKPDGSLALIDFGTAREVTGTYYVKHAGGMVTGFVSAGYTPPEQLNGHAVPQSDFFALGRTFVYLLTGFKPNHPKLYDAINDELNWRKYAPKISPKFADLIDWLMARTPKQRPPNTRAIWQRLEELQQGLKNASTSSLGGPSEVGMEIKDRWRLVPPPPPPPKSLGGTTGGRKGGNSQPPTALRLPPSPFPMKNPSRYSGAANLSDNSGPKTVPDLPPQFVSDDATDTLFSGTFPLDFTLGSSLHSLLKPSEWTSTKLHHTLTGHMQPVSAVCISPDGQILASGSDDNTIKLWEIATGEEIATLASSDVLSFQTITGIVFLPSGEMLVSSSDDGSIKLWEVATGNLTGTIASHPEPLHCLAISPDGQILAAGSDDSTILLYRLPQGEKIGTLPGHTEPVYALAISPDGQILAAGSADNTIKLYRLADRQEIATLWGHSAPVRALAISPDAQQLASGSADSKIKIWDIPSQREINTLVGHSDWVLSLAYGSFSGGLVLASASWDNTIKLWNSRTGELLCNIEGHSMRVSSVGFSPDGTRLASGGWDCTIKIWGYR